MSGDIERHEKENSGKGWSVSGSSARGNRRKRSFTGEIEGYVKKKAAEIGLSLHIGKAGYLWGLFVC